MRPEQLTLSGRQMRDLGERLLNFIIAWHQGAAHASVGKMGERNTLEQSLGATVSATGRPIDEVWSQVIDVVLPHALRLDHPRFFAFVPSPNNFGSVIADALASACNVFAGSWIGGSGAAQLESNTIRWLCDACGLPAGAGGHFVSGGSHASLTALMLAREERLQGPLEKGTA